MREGVRSGEGKSVRVCERKRATQRERKREPWQQSNNGYSQNSDVDIEPHQSQAQLSRAVLRQ